MCEGGFGRSSRLVVVIDRGGWSWCMVLVYGRGGWMVEEVVVVAHKKIKQKKTINVFSLKLHL